MEYWTNKEALGGPKAASDAHVAFRYFPGRSAPCRLLEIGHCVDKRHPFATCTPTTIMNGKHILSRPHAASQLTVDARPRCVR